MPNYAYLKQNFLCLQCGTLLTDVLWFQWGYSAHSGMWNENVYLIGDSIKWRKCADTITIPDWSIFTRFDHGINIGSPKIENLIIRDITQYYLYYPCNYCGKALDGLAMEIKEGTIVRAWLVVPGEFVETGQYNAKQYYQVVDQSYEAYDVSNELKLKVLDCDTTSIVTAHY